LPVNLPRSPVHRYAADRQCGREPESRQHPNSLSAAKPQPLGTTCVSVEGDGIGTSPTCEARLTLMSEDHDAEPVFVRSKWGTNRYVYNANNPVGMVLIIASLLFAAGGMYSLHDSSSWSEGELHDAVHAAVDSLNAAPQQVGGWRGDYEELIADAIEASGEGPEHGIVSVSSENYGADIAGEPDSESFEVRTDDVDAVYCLRVSPPASETFTAVTVSLEVTVDADSC
jgi:hypothetical protein